MDSNSDKQDAAYWLVKKSQGLNDVESKQFDDWLYIDENKIEFESLLAIDNELNDKDLFDPVELKDLL